MDMDESDGWVDEWVIIERGSGMVHGQCNFRHRYTIFKHIQ
jgi:hypothetical protein